MSYLVSLSALAHCSAAGGGAVSVHTAWVLVYNIECIIISCFLYLGGSKLSTNATCEQGSALQRTKGSPVYPGGHLQMARLPAHSVLMLASIV